MVAAMINHDRLWGIMGKQQHWGTNSLAHQQQSICTFTIKKTVSEYYLPIPFVCTHTYAKSAAATTLSLLNTIYHPQDVCACVDSLTWSSATLTLLRSKVVTTEKNVLPNPCRKNWHHNQLSLKVCPLSLKEKLHTYTHWQTQSPKDLSIFLLRKKGKDTICLQVTSLPLHVLCLSHCFMPSANPSTGMHLPATIHIKLT